MSDTVRCGDDWHAIPCMIGYYANKRGEIGSRWATLPKGKGKGRGGIIGLSPNIRTLKGTKDRKGYLQVHIKEHGTRKIHRLILQAFVGPCPEGMEVRHLNGIPNNNRLENLAWGTPKENQRDKHQHNTQIAGEKHHWSKLTSIQVRAIRELYSSGSWKQAEVARVFGVSVNVVWSIVHRRHRITCSEEIS